MKILCVIDSLGSGGAQRQMVNLLCGLKAKGHDAELFVYYPGLSFFRTEIDAAGITVHEVIKGNGFSFRVISVLVKLMRSGEYSAVISFLRTPNIYVELAKVIARPKLKLIVSERSSSIREGASILQKLPRLLHAFADAVVANSVTHANWLRKHEWLNNKTHVIYNGYKLSESKFQAQLHSNRHVPTFLVVGRIDSGKNGVRLIEALILFQSRRGFCPSVSWAGRQEYDAKSLETRSEMDRLLDNNPQISAAWKWIGERNDIPQLLEDCDALIHVSLYEGLPNVVCEAFIAGRPVIASNVCDHPLLVEDGKRGVLCDPLSSESICKAIESFLAIGADNIFAMGQNARQYAEQNLTIERMVAEYEILALDHAF